MIKYDELMLCLAYVILFVYRTRKQKTAKGKAHPHPKAINPMKISHKAIEKAGARIVLTAYYIICAALFIFALYIAFGRYA